MDSWPAPEAPRLPGEAVPLRLMDTSAGQVRPLALAGTARMYVCGITPYDATHMGHAATYVTFDVLHRVLLDAGLRVDYVQNVTDVDDPLLERATATGVQWTDLALDQVALFRRDMAALRVIPPRWYVGAVEAIPEVVDLIGLLAARGATYILDGDVYFDAGASPHIGSVANLDYPAMLALSRERGGDPDRPGKRDPLDPLLWHRGNPGDPVWDSPFGPGRPGWHVECAAIARTRLGDCLDVQGGGRDLAFPHHEFCAAQMHAATGAWPFARAFVHTGMIGLAGAKMSKSLGNLVRVSRLLADGADPMAVRLALLAGDYHADRDWSAGLLSAAVVRLDRWRRAASDSRALPAEPVVAHLRAVLADDLNTPAALAAVDQWAADTLRGLGDDTAAAGRVRAAVDALLGVIL